MRMVRRDVEPLDVAPGVYGDVPFDTYKRWNAMSKSMTGPALRSGRHLEAYINAERASAAMRLGSLVDAMALEPVTVDGLFAVQPDTYVKDTWKGRAPNKELVREEKPWNMNSNTCKAIMAELEVSGKTVVSRDDWDFAVACRVALETHPLADEAIKGGEKQVSLVWADPDTGVLCKGRPDLIHGDYIYDLKTTMDASPEAFARTMANFGYHIQAGIYTEAYRALTGRRMDFRFIVVETGQRADMEPQVAVYEMLHDDESMVAGRLQFKRAVQRVAHYGDDPAGLPGYSRFAEPISIPRWAINREFDLHDEVEI